MELPKIENLLNFVCFEFLFLNGTSKNRKLDEFCVLRVFRWFIVLFLNGTSKNRKLDEFCVLRVFRWFIVGWKVYFFAKVSFGGECGNPTKDGPTEAQRSNGFGNNEGFKVRKRAIT